jgi:hypothetical protein
MNSSNKQDDSPFKFGINVALDKRLGKLLLIITGCVLINIVVGVIIGCNLNHSNLEREAIQQKYAEYATHPETGGIYFRWKRQENSIPNATLITK